MNKYCVKCGQEIKEGNNYCENCGTKKELNENDLKLFKLYKLSIIIWAISIIPINDIFNESIERIKIINILFIYLRPITSVFLLITSAKCSKNNIVSKKIIPKITTVIAILSMIWSIAFLIFVYFVEQVFNYIINSIF